MYGSPSGGRPPDLVDAAATWVERRTPDWAVTGRVDQTVDQVLDRVAMLVAGVGTGREVSA